MNIQESKKLEQKLIKLLKDYIKKDDFLILGISGGPDSLFLLKIMEIFQTHIPCNLVIAHLNHQLRKEADSEELFVKKMTASHLFHTKTLNIKTLSQKSKKGVEETGRTHRYKFFNQLAKKYQAAYILTAHHANDNTETLLMNLIRGASLTGLSGMPILEDNLLRPLLNIPKNQIIDYLKFYKIPFKTDQSNKDNTYRRNFLRNKVIPLLEDINPNLSETLAKNSRQIREINNFLQTEAQKWITKNTLNKSHTRFSAKSFRLKHPALQKTILRQIHQNLTGFTKNLESTHINEALNLIYNNVGNKKKKMGKVTIILNKNIISFT